MFFSHFYTYLPWQFQIDSLPLETVLLHFVQPQGIVLPDTQMDLDVKR